MLIDRVGVGLQLFLKGRESLFFYFPHIKYGKVLVSPPENQNFFFATPTASPLQDRELKFCMQLRFGPD
jgi:hypothetical protein